MITTFKLTQSQETKLEDWKEAIRKIYGDYGSFDYIFSPTGEKNLIKVFSHQAKAYLDLTETETNQLELNL